MGKWFPLHSSLIFGDLSAAKDLFERGTRDPGMLLKSNSKGWKALHFACHSGHHESVRVSVFDDFVCRDARCCSCTIMLLRAKGLSDWSFFWSLLVLLLFCRCRCCCCGNRASPHILRDRWCTQRHCPYFISIAFARAGWRRWSGFWV